MAPRTSRPISRVPSGATDDRATVRHRARRGHRRRAHAAAGRRRALFFGPTLFYLISDSPWQLYALLFFAPDLGLLGYLVGPRIGAIAYNALHSTVAPLLLALVGMLMLWPLAGRSR